MPETVRILIECAARSDCGMDSDELGLVWVYAASLPAMMRFADEVYAARDRFPHA